MHEYSETCTVKERMLPGVNMKGPSGCIWKVLNGSSTENELDVVFVLTIESRWWLKKGLFRRTTKQDNNFSHLRSAPRRKDF